MNTHDDELLANVKKVAAWADMQRKMTKWSLLFVLLFIPAMVVFAVTMEHCSEKRKARIRASGESWSDVYGASCDGHVEKAIRIGASLIQKTPGYEAGHSRLAFLYLTAGDLTRAEHHFEEAHRLFPSHENRGNLEAVRRRIAQESQPSPSE